MFLFQTDMDVSTTSSSSSGASTALLVFYVAFAVLMVAGMWKSFSKAGHPGWAAIVPIYNLYVWTKVAGKDWWWLLLFFIPCANIVAAVVLSLATAEKFGKSAAYGIGLWLLGPIFWPILGFGSAQYQGSTAS